jgi:hypothetical protein
MTALEVTPNPGSVSERQVNDEIASPALPPGYGLPAGYRQGMVTAATFLLGFTLAFARVWSFEPGDWVWSDLFEGGPLLGGGLLILWALFRSLDLADEHEAAFMRTRRILFIGTLLALAGIIATVVSSPPPNSGARSAVNLGKP